MAHSIVRKNQKPLRSLYRDQPDDAWVVDSAHTSGSVPNAPFHTTVEPMTGSGVRVPIGVHRKLGGPHDAPTPGDILCAALASCADSTLRMVANVLGVEITHLAVRVFADVDVRGTLMMNPTVPVGFQAMRVEVDLEVAEGTESHRVEQLKMGAEHCCVVLQTLRTPPPVAVTWNAGGANRGCDDGRMSGAQPASERPRHSA